MPRRTARWMNKVKNGEKNTRVCTRLAKKQNVRIKKFRSSGNAIYVCKIACKSAFNVRRSSCLFSVPRGRNISNYDCVNTKSWLMTSVVSRLTLKKVTVWNFTSPLPRANLVSRLLWKNVTTDSNTLSLLDYYSHNQTFFWRFFFYF